MLCFDTTASPLEMNEHLAAVTCDHWHLLQKEHKKDSRIKELRMHSDKTSSQMNTHSFIMRSV